MRLVTQRAGVRSALLTGAALLVVGTIAQGTTRLALNLIAGRSLGPKDFGHLTLCLAIVQFTALLWPTTLGAATTKYIAAASTPGAEGGLVRYFARASVLTSLATGLIAGVGWLFLGSSSLAAAALTAIIGFAYGQYHFTRGLLLGKQRFARSTLLEFTLSAVCLLGAVIVSVTWNTGLGYAACLGAGLATYALVRPGITAAPPPLGADARRDITTYILVGTVGTVASTGFLQISVLAASHWGGAKGVGLYGAALAVATPASIFAAALGTALLPSLSWAHSKGETGDLATLSDRAMRGLNVLAVPLFGSLVFCADQLNDLLWGQAFTESVPLLRILLIAVMLKSCTIPAMTRLSATSTRSLALATRVSVLGVVVSATFWVIVAPTAGTEGVAWGYLSGTAITAAALFVACWRFDAQHWGSLAALTLVAGAVLTTVAALEPTLPWVVALAAALGFSVSYVGAAALTARNSS